jgi:hypothetical protein
MIELDREKSDYVFYKYYNNVLEDQMSDMGITQGYGSYSDICELMYFGTCAINLGIGYAYAHNYNSSQSLNQLNNALNIVDLLVGSASNYYYADQEVPVVSYSNSGWNYQGRAWEEDEYWENQYQQGHSADYNPNGENEEVVDEDEAEQILQEMREAQQLKDDYNINNDFID